MWLPEQIRKGYIGYADDILIVLGGRDVVELKENIEKVAELTINYMSVNHLKVNPSRGYREKGNNEISIRVAGEIVTELPMCKVLGIVMQPDLKWPSN